MKKLLMIALVSAGYAALAAEYTLKSTVSGVFDWTDASNYVGESAPTGDPSDVIKVPAGVSVTLTDQLGAGSLALFDAIDRIAPQADDSVVTIDVETGRTLALECAINTAGSSSGVKGKILKTGGGTVELNSYVRASGARFPALGDCRAAQDLA